MISESGTGEGCLTVANISITYELFKKIDEQAFYENIPVSQLVEKLLCEAIREKTISIGILELPSRS